MKRLRPFFSYFGSKWRMAPKYPAPIYDTIIEPFAGSAQYATLWYDRNVILCDASEYVCGVWEYLIRVTPQEIAALPSYVEHIDDFPHLPQEVKWLIGFALNQATVKPGKKITTFCKYGIARGWANTWSKPYIEILQRQLQYIRHWRVIHGAYSSLCNPFATWFIDPPYAGKAGELYLCNIRCYTELALWCMNRMGQAIVCENTGATWLPFETLATIKSSNKNEIMCRFSSEAMYHAINGEKQYV